MKKCPRCNGTGTISTNNKYKKGRNYEYIVRQKLLSKGYEVKRSYASKGVFDLLSWKSGICYGIQVKSLSTKNKAYLTPKDRLSLNNHLLSDSEYLFHRWDSKLHGVVPEKINEKIIPIHAYKDGLITKYRQLVDKDTWIDWKP